MGHISRECTAQPSDKSKGSSSTQSSVTSNKSGFFVVRDEDPEHAANGSHFPVAFETSQCGGSHLWLKKFVEDRRRKQLSGEHDFEQSEAAYKSAQSEGFCGITTHSAHGVVDTAAEGGLIGSLALQRLNHSLEAHGLTCKWTPKRSSAKGVGGTGKGDWCRIHSSRFGWFERHPGNDCSRRRCAVASSSENDAEFASDN